MIIDTNRTVPVGHIWRERHNISRKLLTEKSVHETSSAYLQNGTKLKQSIKPVVQSAPGIAFGRHLDGSHLLNPDLGGARRI